ncbi:MAG: type I restriction enzyme HsdR N-terminal domain-containing protein [Bacteroidales bacterium]|nr:type I restriction enzyme HsdR N-terminal domain-containing protein [Bacteroidales bacterium]
MESLNLPVFPFRLKEEGGKRLIFDAFRKKYVSLTPEEWVRQHFLAWLHLHKGYPAGLIAVEVSLKYNNMQKRADAMVYGREALPLMMVECKAPGVKITQAAFDQIARYNFSFGVKYLAVTNGLEHFCCMKTDDGPGWIFLEDIPDFGQLSA